jgi:hypothetical protein
MRSLLHQLENNEAVLLMYLADELSAEDRAEVEHMLGSDASMRAELERLRSLSETTVATLDRWDAASRVPVAEGVAVRRAARMMRQWQVDHATAPPVEEALPELRFPWWSYPLTTAAAVLIAFLVWWGNRAEHQPTRIAQQGMEPLIGPQDLQGWSEDFLAHELADSFEVSDEELLRMAQARHFKDLVAAYATNEDKANDL